MAARLTVNDQPGELDLWALRDHRRITGAQSGLVWGYVARALCKLTGGQCARASHTCRLSRQANHHDRGASSVAGCAAKRPRALGA